MLLQSIFAQGALEMSATPLPPVEYAAQWTDILSNRILAVVVIVAALLDIPDFLTTLPHILDGLTSRRGSSRIEHSMSIARSRNMSALIAAGAFLLMADRYKLYCPSFFEPIPEGWTVAALAAVLMAYLILRRMVLPLVPKRKLGGEDRQAAHRALYTVSIVMVAVQFLAVGILSVAGCSDLTIRLVLLALMGVFFALNLAVLFQILAAHFSGFATFLYLCALEILPAGVILAVGLLL